MQITINPQLTSNAAGTFGVEWDGFIQGVAMPDPVARYALAGGRLLAAAALPMWGGVGISEAVPSPQGSPPTTPDVMLGGAVDRATNVTGGSTALNLTGFSVFDQNYSMINSPQSPVQLGPQGGQVNFYRLGSGARVVVAISPELAASIVGDVITSQVSWDFVSQMLIPYQAAYAANVITAASWASTGGGQITYTTTTNHGVAVGSVVQISGFTPDGYNGQFVTIAGTATDQLVVSQPVNPGADTVQGSLLAGGGALNVRVLKVKSGNCMTVDYDTDTGFATWNRNGSAALILL